jgi:hypothetical protein
MATVGSFVDALRRYCEASKAQASNLIGPVRAAASPDTDLDRLAEEIIADARSFFLRRSTNSSTCANSCRALAKALKQPDVLSIVSPQHRAPLAAALKAAASAFSGETYRSRSSRGSHAPAEEAAEPGEAPSPAAPSVPDVPAQEAAPPVPPPPPPSLEDAVRTFITESCSAEELRDALRRAVSRIAEESGLDEAHRHAVRMLVGGGKPTATT